LAVPGVKVGLGDALDVVAVHRCTSTNWSSGDRGAGQRG
jgi:hypothetical protein